MVDNRFYTSFACRTTNGSGRKTIYDPRFTHKRWVSRNSDRLLLFRRTVRNKFPKTVFQFIAGVLLSSRRSLYVNLYQVSLSSQYLSKRRPTYARNHRRSSEPAYGSIVTKASERTKSGQTALGKIAWEYLLAETFSVLAQFLSSFRRKLRA